MAKFEKAQYEKMGGQEVDAKLKDGLMGPGGLRLKPKERALGASLRSASSGVSGVRSTGGGRPSRSPPTTS